MIKISIDYTGQLRCRSLHTPSGQTLESDAPVDNNGLGQSFSPTDLVATALGSCMATVMGIVAQKKGYDLAGMSVEVEKHMSEDLPRRIVLLAVSIKMPVSQGHPDRELLEKTALSCPVYNSLDPKIDVPVTWCWDGGMS